MFPYVVRQTLTRFPSGEKRTALPAGLVVPKPRSRAPSAAPCTCTAAPLPRPHTAIFAPSGENASPCTYPCSSLRHTALHSFLRVFTLKEVILPSVPPATRCAPSGENATALMSCLCEIR